MKEFSSVQELKAYLTNFRDLGQKISFVPTMGALHEGHMSLIHKAQELSENVICSIFVNPTQFNNAEDLKKYPRTEKEDLAMLEKANCSIAFVPNVKDIYPEGQSTKPLLNLNGADLVMEGKFRPGHFEGMLQVVKRLLEIVEPDFLIMGQKDFQQYSLVAMMIHELKIPTQLIVSATVREKDGLAMSSRNKRLDSVFHKKSNIIFSALSYAKQQYKNKDIEKLKAFCTQMINNEGLKTEYFEIVDANTLKNINTFSEKTTAVACVAAWAGDVRLIDNLSISS